MRASGFGGAQLGYAFVELACAVGNDAELALDEHELGAVVHFVFLGAEEAFETRFHGFAIGLGNSYDEKFGRQGSSQEAKFSPSVRRSSTISALVRGLASSAMVAAGFGNILGCLNGVFADGSKSACQFFTTVRHEFNWGWNQPAEAG